MLKDKIQDDLKSAMISKDEEKLSTIRMLKSAIQYFEIQKGGSGYEATDEDVIEVIGREVKKRKNLSCSMRRADGKSLLIKKKRR